VRDGAEALDFIFNTGEYAERADLPSPKVILLDLKLPRSMGWKFLRRIKADPRTRSIPVVMLTSSREDKDVVESYSLGVNSYIVKPVDFVQFTRSRPEPWAMYWMLLNNPPVNQSIVTR